MPSPNHGLALLLLCATQLPGATTIIFPEPRELEVRSARFNLDESVHVLIPKQASEEDRFLARSLVAELSDKHGIPLEIQEALVVPAGGRFILMGAATNPLVRAYLGRNASERVTEPEGYYLEVNADAVVVAGADDAGAFYGLQSLRQLIEGQHREIQGMRVRDWPYKPFRGIKLYLPGHENVAYFKRFVRDVMALYKFNKMILEVNAGMRLDRHPELNAGWMELGRDLNYTRRDRSWGPGRQFQDSANADTADGGVLEKEEVADLMRYAGQHHIEVIPEIPSLTHSYYLLTRHRELAEITDAEWPDTYCPLAPGVYRLLFDVLDEYIGVMNPKMVHIGHDEWRMPWGVCPRCKGRDPRELFAQDVNKIHAYLSQKNIRTAMYGDHLMEPLRGGRLQKIANPKGLPYETPGGLSAEQVTQLIPKDILIFNWFWDDRQKNEGEPDDIALENWGFHQVYGNFQPSIQNYSRRSSRRSVIGGAPSSWAATNEFNFGKDLMFDFLGSAQFLWSTSQPRLDQLSETVQRLLPGVRRNLSPTPFPSAYDPVVPVDIQASLNSAPPGRLRSGQVVARANVFELARNGDKRVIAVQADGSESAAIRIAEDASSIVFLHASAKPAGNIPAYEGTWNYADTADLLGWYEVRYEDGLVETVPIRYGVNILEAGWGTGHAPGNLAYEAELVECGEAGRDRITFFAYEWINPRPGIRIREIRLKGSSAFQNVVAHPAPQNTIMLAGISVVKKRTPPNPTH
jgi:glycosyl hydrolase family 20